MYEKIIAVYFSATGNTKTYVDAMLQEAGVPFEIVDISKTGTAPQITLQEKELLLFAAPDYSGRIPYFIHERLQHLQGKGADAVLVVTFGNRAIDDALVEMEDIVKGKGFTVVGGAGFVGKHTFGAIATDRPSPQDKKEAKEFLNRILQKEKHKAVQMPGNRPYKEASTRGKWHPQTLDTCVACGRCQRECPVGAIAADCKTIEDTCVSCFHCISICPLHAKQMETAEYKAFASSLQERLAQPQKNEIYL